MKRLILCITCIITALAVTPAIAGILNPNPDVDDYGQVQTLLCTSFGKGKTDFIRDLLKKAGDELVNGVPGNPYKNGTYVISACARHGTKEEWAMVTKYVKSDEQYKIEKTGYHSLLFDSASNDKAGLEITKFLVEQKKIDVNAVGKDGITPIFGPTANLDIAEYLVSKGADVNATTPKDNITPLKSSCSFANDSADYTIFLLKHGADVLAANRSGSMPLDSAIQSGQTKSIPALIKELKKKLPPEADVINTSIGIWDREIPDQGFFSPLFLAVRSHEPESIKTLLECGANPNVINKDGQTPLHYALTAMYDKPMPAMVEALLAGGADPCATNKSGETGYDLALRHGKRDLINLFGKYNAAVRGPGLQQASLRQ